LNPLLLIRLGFSYQVQSEFPAFWVKSSPSKSPTGGQIRLVPEERENWIADQVDRGVDVVISNPELVKTGLDLLDFQTIVFMQSGYNAYTLQQAARRSWRIGQTKPVEVYFLGFAATAQIQCLELMAKKIAVSQSTSGEIPDCGLDVLNQDGDSVEMELARQLIDA